MHSSRLSDEAKWTLVIIGGLFAYSAGGVTLHFFNHFFPGVALGVIILIGLVLWGRETKRYEFVIPFAAYLYAIIPEFVAMTRTAARHSEAHHAGWENVFLLHTTLDHWLEATELILPLTALMLAVVVVIYRSVAREP